MALRWVGLAAATLCVACATQRVPLEEQLAGDYGLDLQVVSPRPGASVHNSAGLVEVTGRVGRDWLLSADIVLAIDLSNSTLLASGIDLDGDGKLGKTHHFAEGAGGRGRPWRSWTSDPDDTIVEAEFEAARQLIRSLDSIDVRIGVLTYTASSRVRAPLGSAPRALAALDEIRIVEDWSGTDVSRALRESRDLFRAAQHLEGAERPRVVFLFSDGKVTTLSTSDTPRKAKRREVRYWAKRAAIREAQELTEQHIAVCTLGFGESIVSEEPEEDDIAFLNELARTTGCGHVPIDSPDLLRFDRPPRHNAATHFQLRNLTTGKPGRAVRLLRTGLFDGFVDLVPGPNLLEVSAVLPDGSRLASQRVIHYQPSEQETEEEREATARLLLRLRDRATQLDESTGDAPEPPPGSDPL